MKHVLLIVVFFYNLSTVAQQADYVDFKVAKVEVSPNVEDKSVSGTVRYNFDVLKKVDSIFIDAILMEFDKVLLNNDRIEYINDGKKLWLIHNFNKGDSYSVSFNYKARPKQALYFIGWDNAGPNQIWTQGQGKYTSNWLPSFDDMNEKVEFDLTIKFDKEYQVIANGKLTNKQINESTITWHYNMEQPMSSYLVAMVIGEYHKKTETSESGIPLEMYYYPKDSAKVEPTYRYSKRIFDFFEEEIGVPYPWQNYKQIPVHDFLYGGMENTSATIFADSYVVDSIAFVDNNYVNVNAHELAHQWFGDLVTATEGTHHWLQEGFATYYALLAEKEIFGDDYYYWRLFEYVQELELQEKADQGTALVNAKASSITFYKKGALALHMLREFVGDDAFRSAVVNYLEAHKFKNVATDDFLNEVAAASGADLKAFTNDWLVSDVLPYAGIMDHLKHKSKLISTYEIVDCTAMSSKCLDYISPDFPNQVQSKVISQISDRVTSGAFKTPDVKVRQALATYITKIPSDLKADYESLLHDKSYITLELALYNLWNNFEQDRVRYLEATKEVVGLNDKNVRLLWLVLALSTPDYNDDHKASYYNELVGYTSAKYNFQVRQSAFQYLKMLKVCNDACITNLEDAAKHHNWRLSKFAKQMLNELKE